VKLRVRVAVASLAFAYSIGSWADEAGTGLRDGPEAVSVRAHCSACHSLDYIQMNSPFMKRAAWEAEVRKMMKVMGAPIAEPDVAPLVDYLTRNYGVD
jgi:sulfite dehydrogenase (cytochrome) subunit B